MNRAATACLALVTLALAGCSSSGPTAHLHVDFGAARPAVDADVTLEGCTTNCTARMQLLQWRDHGGLPVDVEHFSFGDCVARIGGVPAASGCQPGATAYWSLAVNGADPGKGMDEVVLKGGDRVSWTLTPIAPAPPPAGGTALALALQAPAGPTRNATVAVAGTVSRAARISLTLAHGNVTTRLPAVEASAGAWTAQVALPPGNSTLTALADDGAATATATTHLVRHAHGTMQVAFRGLPGHPDRDDEVWFDPDSRPSAPAYQGQAVAHPAYANVHDLMAAWTAQTGVPVVYKPHPSLGQQVMQIDGVGDPTLNSAAFWCYQLNGASAGLGITAQEFHDGDVVAWSLGTVC